MSPIVRTLVLAGLGLAAGRLLEAESPLLQLQMNAPRGGLRTLAGNRPGFAFGIQGEKALDGLNRLRPRLDLSFFPLVKLSGIQNTASNLSAGCDLIHFMGTQGWASSLYGVGGVSAVRWSLDSGDTTRLGLSVGAGLKVGEGLSWECRCSWSAVNSRIRARTLGMGLVFRL